MPLPVGHSLMGYALSEATKVRLAKKTWLDVFIFVALANLPDIDFLPGFLLGQPNRYHHHLVHSLSFSLFAGLAGGLIYWQLARKSINRHPPQDAGRFRFWLYFLTISGVVFSHCVLDLLTEDSSPPFGMILFWPLDMAYYDLSWTIFGAVHKSDTSSTFFLSLLNWHNFKVALQEFLIMAPLIGLLKIIKQWRRFFPWHRVTDIKKTQVAKLGLLEVSPLPPQFEGRRSLATVAQIADEDEQHD